MLQTSSWAVWHMYILLVCTSLYGLQGKNVLVAYVNLHTSTL